VNDVKRLLVYRRDEGETREEKRERVSKSNGQQ
jgi:hypothetical protein